MISPSPKRFFLLFFILLVIIGLDAASKSFIVHTLPNYTPFLPSEIVVFRNFIGIDFSLIHEINRGAAWGIFANFQPYLMFVRFALIMALFIYLCFFNKHLKTQLPFLLILAGAIGNVIDFFIYGHVVDMFQFVLWGYHYPVFNIADISICCGVLWLGMQMIRDSIVQYRAKGVVS